MLTISSGLSQNSILPRCSILMAAANGLQNVGRSKPLVNVNDDSKETTEADAFRAH